MAALPTLLFCVRCAPAMNVYGGTGVLQSSGSPLTELASHSVVLSYCLGDAEARPAVDPFAIVAIGDRCTVEGAVDAYGFRPDPGAVCTLVFPGGERTLRVTDLVRRYGDEEASGDDFGGTEVASASDVDSSAVDVRIEGDDVKSGKHATYSFSGRAMRVEPSEELCARERPRHERAVSRQ